MKKISLLALIFCLILPLSAFSQNAASIINGDEKDSVTKWSKKSLRDMAAIANASTSVVSANSDSNNLSFVYPEGDPMCILPVGTAEQEYVILDQTFTPYPPPGVDPHTGIDFDFVPETVPGTVYETAFGIEYTSVEIIAPFGGVVERIIRHSIYSKSNGEYRGEIVNVIISYNDYWCIGLGFEPQSADTEICDLQAEAIQVTEGQTINQGDVIGRLIVVEKQLSWANSHLHAELITGPEPGVPPAEDNYVSVNPANYLTPEAEAQYQSLYSKFHGPEHEQPGIAPECILPVKPEDQQDVIRLQLYNPGHPQHPHGGLDFIFGEESHGVEIVSPVSGVVTEINRATNPNGCDWITMVISHESGWNYMIVFEPDTPLDEYANLQESWIDVEVGDVLEAGDRLGRLVVVDPGSLNPEWFAHIHWTIYNRIAGNSESAHVYPGSYLSDQAEIQLEALYQRFGYQAPEEAYNKLFYDGGQTFYWMDQDGSEHYAFAYIAGSPGTGSLPGLLISYNPDIPGMGGGTTYYFYNSDMERIGGYGEFDNGIKGEFMINEAGEVIGTKMITDSGDTIWFLWGENVYEFNGQWHSDVAIYRDADGEWRLYGDFSGDINNPEEIMEESYWTMIASGIPEPDSSILPELGDWWQHCVNNGILPEFPPLSTDYTYDGQGRVIEQSDYNLYMDTTLTYQWDAPEAEQVRVNTYYDHDGDGSEELIYSAIYENGTDYNVSNIDNWTLLAERFGDVAYLTEDVVENFENMSDEELDNDFVSNDPNRTYIVNDAGFTYEGDTCMAAANTNVNPVRTTFTVGEGGTDISFWWRAVLTGNYWYHNWFEIKDEENKLVSWNRQFSASYMNRDTGWRQETFHLDTAGTYTLKWWANGSGTGITYLDSLTATNVEVRDPLTETISESSPDALARLDVEQEILNQKNGIPANVSVFPSMAGLAGDKITEK